MSDFTDQEELMMRIVRQSCLHRRTHIEDNTPRNVLRYRSYVTICDDCKSIINFTLIN